jgi:hypothetical protein
MMLAVWPSERSGILIRDDGACYKMSNSSFG